MSSNTNLLTDLNSSTSSFLNLLNISQQFSSPTSVPKLENGTNSFYSSSAQNQFPYSFLSQFYSKTSDADSEETDAINSSADLKQRKLLSKCSDLEKNSIYQ